MRAPETIHLVVGWDEREAVGGHVFLQSVIEKCSLPVDVTILTPALLKELGVGTDGTNAFSKARFLTPYLKGWCGYAIFADGADMLCNADLADLWALRSPDMAVQVVKHDYTPRNKKKYVGTDMESSNEPYPRKQWSSLVLWHCSYVAHRQLTPSFVEGAEGSFLHRFKWLPDDRIGALPKEWNWLCDEDNQAEKPNLIHWTNGQPGFRHYEGVAYSDEWKQTWSDMNKGLQYSLQVSRER
jgi:hypothetical protein